jgi:hypothetical protein
MNRELNRVGILFGCFVAGAGLISTVMAGCGSSNSSEDGGTDATTDSSGDVMTAETSSEGSNDAGDAAETSLGADAPLSVDGDAAEVTDSASGFVDVGDVAIDAPSISQFPHAVDVAYCTRLQECCLVPPSQWNLNGASGCVPLVDQGGGLVGIGAFNPALDSGLVLYDASAAKTCLDFVLSFSCGDVPASAYNTIKTVCFGALQGTLAAGAGPCVNALECQGGLYCQVAADGGPGACAPLKTQGEPCTDTRFSTDCTYLGNGTPALFCFNPADGGTPTCQPAVPVDGGCTTEAQCQSLVCNYPVCSNVEIFSDPGQPNGTCEFFTLPDAGGD